MSQYSYDNSPEKKLTTSLSAHASTIQSELQQLLALYQKRDDNLQQHAEGIINDAKEKAKAIVDAANKDAEAIRHEKLAWEAEKKKIASTHALEPDVTINVGGNVFTTTMTTLRRFPDTMIGVMFSGRHALHTNKDGAIALDRDGTHFRHILNFLRDPANYSVDHLSNSETIELKREATYYGLGELMFPWKKAADETVQTTQNYAVVASQDDEGLWYLKFGNQAKSLVAQCRTCKSGSFTSGHMFLQVRGFFITRVARNKQPMMAQNSTCHCCGTY